MRGINQLAWRNLRQSPGRTLLSAFIVALSVAITIASGMISGAIQSALTGAGAAEDVQQIMTWMVEGTGAMLNIISIVILLVAGFLIFNAFAMSITRRRQEIGALRALGMTRRQVMRIALLEGLIVSIMGTLFGMVVGPLFGNGVIALFRTLSNDLFSFGETSVSPDSVILAGAIGIGVTLLSVLIPARNASRITPLAALRETEAAGVDTVSTRRAVIGLVIMLALLAYLLLARPGDWIQPPGDLQLTLLCLVTWLVCWGAILPALIGKVGDWSRGFLSRRWGATGRLISDNLQRGRQRVTLTILTLAVSLTMIIGLTGFITYLMQELFGGTTPVSEQRIRTIMPFDMSLGMAAYVSGDLESLQLPTEAVQIVHDAVGGQAIVLDYRFALVPEFSFLLDNYFSFVVDPAALRATGSTFFTFNEGNWETAYPIMTSGCGLLVAPMVAARNNAGVGDVITAQGVNGPVECTVAGIGFGFVNATIIGNAAIADFDIHNPMAIAIVPIVGTNETELDQTLTDAITPYPVLHLGYLDTMIDLQLDMANLLVPMFNGLLLVAVLGAALGIVNTTVISVTERQRELGLLRAIGATRKQARRVVIGEAALMGLIGGVVGLLAGTGVVVIFILTYGGNAWGLDLDLFGAVMRTLRPVLITGIVGLVIAPLIAAWAAFYPTRTILRGSPIETLQSAPH